MGAITMTLSAQEQGDFSVGGTIGVTGGSASLKTSTTTNDQTNTTNSSAPEATGFKLAPMFNYFVIDNLQLSAGLSYQMDKTFKTTDANNKNLFNFSHTALFVIGAHYYVPVIKGSLYYTPGIEFGFGGGSKVSQNGDGSSTTTKIPFAFAFNANLGTVEFKPIDCLGITLNVLDFTITTVTNRREMAQANTVYKSTYTTFLAGLNYGISAGVKYYF